MSGKGMRYFLIFLTLAFVFPLIGSYLGALHPLGDSLAVFCGHIAFGLMVVAGDFNMVPWSHVLRSIEDATNTQRAGHLLYTFPMKREWISLPIDHVLVPRPFGTEIYHRPLLGSDHYGVVAHFTMPPDPSSLPDGRVSVSAGFHFVSSNIPGVRGLVPGEPSISQAGLNLRTAF